MWDSREKYFVLKEHNDPFNGWVGILEEKGLWFFNRSKRYRVEHRRKNIMTGNLSRVDAEKKFEEFINDAQFA